MYNQYRNTNIRTGYVVFVDNTSLWWLRFLKQGFRHCYILLNTKSQYNQWIEINPLSNQVIVSEYNFPSAFDYIKHLQENKKCCVVRVEFNQAPLKCAPLGIFTCVEFVKRMLGIHSVLVQTPYKLYKKIKKSQNCRKKVLTI